MLSVSHLALGYERPFRVVNDFSLTIAEGECVGVMGRNGAGKTTLVRGLAGQLRSWGGTVHLDARNITRLPIRARVRAGLATVPEGRQLFGRLTVAENLRVASYAVTRARGRLTGEELQAIFPVLETHWEQEAAGLSGGQQQQVALARAFLGRPSVVVMDEPSLGLSPNLVDGVADAIAAMLAAGASVLLVEQNVGMVQRLCRRAVVLDQGRVAEELDGNALLQTERLLSAYFGQ